MNTQSSNGRPAPWSPAEDSAVVADYLAMLALQSRGLPYNKSKTRRELIAGACAGRSEGSIEFKRCNVSAVLHDLGRAHLTGYRPESGANYQHSLRMTVESHFARAADAAFESACRVADVAVSQPSTVASAA